MIPSLKQVATFLGIVSMILGAAYALDARVDAKIGVRGKIVNESLIQVRDEIRGVRADIKDLRRFLETFILQNYESRV